MIIRHAEKPADNAPGVAPDAALDLESLIVRGWQRAGALVRFFNPLGADPKGLRPNIVFAAGVGPHSNSKRSQQTVTPLVGTLPGVPFVIAHLKEAIDDLVADVLGRTGTVLIAWEHTFIPAIMAAFPHTPASPAVWDHKRFDLVWVLDRQNDAWAFDQIPQMLLPNDTPTKM